MHAQREGNRKTLRRLAGIAYDRELREHLMALHDRFHDWLKERIDGAAMNELIHDFHDGPARRLHVIYHDLSLEMQVARAVARGLLAEDEVPAELREELTKAIEFFQDDVRRADHDAAV